MSIERAEILFPPLPTKKKSPPTPGPRPPSVLVETDKALRVACEGIVSYVLFQAQLMSPPSPTTPRPRMFWRTSFLSFSKMQWSGFHSYAAAAAPSSTASGANGNERFERVSDQRARGQVRAVALCRDGDHHR